MSGHSKWSQIHRQKGVADTKRGAIFTKLGKAIVIAAKNGGGDPEMNFKLRLAVDQAKQANMPKDNIDRAIKKGTGELGGGIIEEISYEGFGPNGTAFIIECLTDNRNRTSAAVKHLLTKHGGRLGGPNAVSWMFEHKGIIRIEKINDELELEIIDAGAQDVIKDEEGVSIYCQPQNLQKIKEFLEQKNINIDYAEVEQIAKEKKEISQEDAEKIQRLLDELEENEDVNNYYTNADI